MQKFFENFTLAAFPAVASDSLARVIGQKLSKKWVLPILIDNRAGTGGKVGMAFVAVAPADGYIFLLSYVGTQAINRALDKRLPLYGCTMSMPSFSTEKTPS